MIFYIDHRIFYIDRDDVLTWVRETLPHDAEDFDIDGIADDVIAHWGWDILGRHDVSHITSSAHQLAKLIGSVDDSEYWNIVEQNRRPTK